MKDYYIKAKTIPEITCSYVLSRRLCIIASFAPLGLLDLDFTLLEGLKVNRIVAHFVRIYL